MGQKKGEPLSVPAVQQEGDGLGSVVGEDRPIGRRRPGGETEGETEPVQGHPAGGGKVVLGQEPVQTAVVSAKVHHAILDTLTAGVAAPLDAGLEDVGGGQQLQLLVPCGEEEPGLLSGGRTCLPYVRPIKLPPFETFFPHFLGN